MLNKFATNLALRRYEARHPRLRASVAPLPGDAVSHIMEWTTPEIIAEAEDRGLKGKTKQRFIEEKVAVARAAAEGMTKIEVM